MIDELTVCRLQPEDASRMAELRKEALVAAPLAFGSSVDDDRFRSVEAIEQALSQEDAVVFGLLSKEALVGMVGLYHSTNTKERHKAHIWGMYVKPEARRRGGATHLLNATIEWARHCPEILQVHLSMTNAAPAAHALYHNAGFVEWGREPQALRWQGEFTDEHHLVFRIDRDNNLLVA